MTANIAQQDIVEYIKGYDKKKKVKTRFGNYEDEYLGENWE